MKLEEIEGSYRGSVELQLSHCSCGGYLGAKNLTHRIIAIFFVWASLQFIFDNVALFKLQILHSCTIFVLFQMDFRKKDIRLSQTKRRRVIYSPINSNTNSYIDVSKKWNSFKWCQFHKRCYFSAYNNFVCFVTIIELHSIKLHDYFGLNYNKALLCYWLLTPIYFYCGHLFIMPHMLQICVHNNSDET